MICTPGMDLVHLEGMVDRRWSKPAGVRLASTKALDQAGMLAVASCPGTYVRRSPHLHPRKQVIPLAGTFSLQVSALILPHISKKDDRTLWVTQNDWVGDPNAYENSSGQIATPGMICHKEAKDTPARNDPAISAGLRSAVQIK